jgi:hypothetical protein
MGGRTLTTCFEVSNAKHGFRSVPGAVNGRDGIPVSTGMLKESHEVIAGDHTGGYEIAKGSHGTGNKEGFCL